MCVVQEIYLQVQLSYVNTMQTAWMQPSELLLLHTGSRVCHLETFLPVNFELKEAGVKEESHGRLLIRRIMSKWLRASWMGIGYAVLQLITPFLSSRHLSFM